MNRKKLLLVDDDELVLATFGNGLREAGFEVELAGSGMEALAIVDKAPPDLAILDVDMPKLSGIETAKAMREFNVPVIFLSAYDDKEFVKGAITHGALGYLVKPIDVARAVPSIEAALARSQELHEMTSKSERLSKALDTGNLVNVTLGLLMERHRLSQQEAFDLLRSKARSERRKVREVASEILDAWHLINELNPKPQSSKRLLAEK